MAEAARGEVAWKRWGPYLAEREWGTVREDYSPHGTCWDYFPHDHARSRAYRWVEDGLFGISDDEGRLCFALALWNERDPILKERLFGLTAQEGNHGEAVKERYAYAAATPTSSFLRAVYRYAQCAYPYAALVEGSRRRTQRDPEMTLEDTGALDGGRYFDIVAEYAKAGPDDILARFTVHNRGAAASVIHLLPTLWFRNTWSWDGSSRPRVRKSGELALLAEHPDLGSMRLSIEAPAGGPAPALLFTENDTNTARLFGGAGPRYAKDAFHAHVVDGRAGAVNPEACGTKAAAHLRVVVPAGESFILRLRLTTEREAGGRPFEDHDEIIAARAREAEELFAEGAPHGVSADALAVRKMAYAGLLHSAMLYHFDVARWLDGDPAQPAPPPERAAGRNRAHRHFAAKAIMLVPDAWEYPWFAAWDLAFHAVAIARLDPDLAKRQLEALLEPGSLHPNGQIPAYEFAFGDDNPPLHAWAAALVFAEERAAGRTDRAFLARVFQPLLQSYTAWVNRAATRRDGLFGGGFLGMDNVSAFDRGRPLERGAELAQADGTGWVAFFAAALLTIAVELARGADKESAAAYELTACRLLDHLLVMGSALNGAEGLWSEEHGVYLDHVHHGDGRSEPIPVRSIAAVIPILAAASLPADCLDRLPRLGARLRDLISREHVFATAGEGGRVMVSAVPIARFRRVLSVVLDPRELLSPFGVRSLSLAHRASPLRGRIAGRDADLTYAPGESNTPDFGENSNWRGPVWVPMTFLVIDALRRYGEVLGEGFTVEYPSGSSSSMPLSHVADDLARRVVSLFLKDGAGSRPCLGARQTDDELLPFAEYFDGDDGHGCGANHQGWTSLVARLIEDVG